MNTPVDPVNKVLFGKVGFSSRVIYRLQLVMASISKKKDFANTGVMRNQHNSILEFASSSFKKGYLPDSCSFIHNKMIYKDTCQCKFCGNILTEINDDYKFNEENPNDDYSNGDYQDETY